MYLLLLLFFMATPKQELQQVQQPVKQDIKSFDRNSIWYTNRPISSKTQTDNRYLDSSIFDWQKSISVWSTSVLDENYSYSNMSKYSFEKIEHDWFVIPVNWTYTITASYFVWWFEAPTSWIVITYLSHYEWISLINTVSSPIPFEACDGNWWTLTYTYNFKKWDTITLYWNNNTNKDLTIRATVTIIKIS